MPLAFVPPKGVADAEVLGIDPDHADVALPRRRAAPARDRASRRYPRAIAHAVRKGNGLGFVAERQCREHRPEDFVLRDAHVARAPVRARRHVVTAAGPAAPGRDRDGAFPLRISKYDRNLFAMRRVNERPTSVAGSSDGRP